MIAPWIVAVSLAAEGPLFVADRAEKVRLWSANDAQLAIDAPNRGMRVVFGTSEWPSIHLKPTSTYDFSKAGVLAVVVHNPNAEAVSLGIRCDDDPSADGWNHSRQGVLTLPPRKTVTIGLGAGVDPKGYGMNGLPRPKGLDAITSSGAPGWEPQHITDVQLFMHRPKRPTAVVVRELRLVPPVTMAGIVDSYGQYTGDNWPGKLLKDGDFATRLAAENRNLRIRPTLPDRDRFGGWTKGPQQRATGFFRTEKIAGKWWLVDPEGNLFFSNGVDCVNTYSDTFVKDRETMFTWLPKPETALAAALGNGRTDHGGQHKEGATVNFYVANLIRKYGPHWATAWKQTALQRLPNWGFNTVGNWSDGTFQRNGRVPYVNTVWVGGNHRRLASGNDYWGLMHDPFDPEFRVSVRNAVASSATLKDDPFCLGTFVDNELSWAGQGPENGRYGLAIGALANGPDSPAKVAMVKMLREKYLDVAALNAAWGTTFSDWKSLEGPYKAPLTFTELQKKDLAAFVALLSDTYHRVVREELKRADPNHLYLGCRFAWYGRDAVEAAAKYSDVLSFNIYRPSLDRKEWDWVTALNRPAIIGEFHFGALDRGMFHTGLVDAGTQAGRAKMYEQYVASVAGHPAFVGCHWFQFIDEPLTGRVLDGENYQIGMVDVTDTPYPETITAARKAHAKVYDLHMRSK